MLDVKFVRENLEAVAAGLKRRGVEFDQAGFKAIEEGRRRALTSVEQLKAQKNDLSRQIGILRRDPTNMVSGLGNSKINDLMGQVNSLSMQITDKELEAKKWEDDLWNLLKNTPNLPHADVPEGLTAEQNRQVRAWGDKPTLPFKPKTHWELGEALGVLDFERAAKITGARFTVYRGAGARLERALLNFMLDLQTNERGYLEHQVPLMVNADSMFGTGQLPKFEEDMFKVPFRAGDDKAEERNFYLIPTAEVPLTNLRRGEVLKEEELPLQYTACTPCFRKEAGAYGKDTKGMVRQHQFNKVELVKFTTPETSYEEHEKLVADAEEVLRRLKLPYRVMLLCAGDMGFGAAKCYDLEVYHAGTDKWWECSSCSNFEDFQARRANIKFKGRDGRTRLAHTLNGSGLATSRLLPAILENYQQADGSVLVPEALRPYLGGVEKIFAPPSGR